MRACVCMCVCVFVCEYMCVCWLCACVYVCVLGVVHPEKVIQNTFKVFYNVATERANGFIGVVHYKNKT